MVDMAIYKLEGENASLEMGDGERDIVSSGSCMSHTHTPKTSHAFVNPYKYQFLVLRSSCVSHLYPRDSHDIFNILLYHYGNYGSTSKNKS